MRGLEAQIARYERQEREADEQVQAVRQAIAALRAEIERETAACAPGGRYEQDIVEVEQAAVAAQQTAEERRRLLARRRQQLDRAPPSWSAWADSSSP